MSEDIAVERTRLVKAQADKLEFELKVKKGKMVEKDYFEKTMAELLSGMRDFLLSLPKILCFDLEMKPKEEIKDILEAKMRDNLELYGEKLETMFGEGK